jgi:hypothetical protein
MDYDDLLDLYNNNDYTYDFDLDIVKYVHIITIPKTEIDDIELFKTFLDSADFDELANCDYENDFERYHIEEVEESLQTAVLPSMQEMSVMITRGI